MKITLQNNPVLRKFTTAFIGAALVALTACGGSSGNNNSLATGGFTKTYGAVDDGALGEVFNNGGDIKQQLLYAASDINGSGYITALRFMHDGALGADTVCPNTSIRLSHTAVTALTTTFATGVEDGHGSQVSAIDDATVTITAGADGAWFEIPLNTTFNYNGVDNLLVEIERTTACTGSNAWVKYDFSTANTRSYVFAVDGTPGTADHSTTTATGTGAALYHVQFVFAGGDNNLQYGVGGNYWPFTNTGRAQYLYTAAEINGSGPITGMAFQVSEATTAETYTATVEMVHTNVVTLSMTWADNHTATPTVVATDVVFNVPAGMVAGDWFWVPLPGSNFNYNGTDNLLIDVKVTAATGHIVGLQTGIITGRRVPGFTTDGATATGDGQSQLPNVKFRFNGGTMDVITDGATSYDIPVGDSGEHIVQVLYDSTALGTGGQITSLGFRLNADSNAFDHTDVNLVLGHTTLSSLGAGSLAANIESNRTAAFSGTISIPAGLKAGDWVEVTLSTPFTYDPTQNLVVQWDSPGFATINDAIGHSGGTGRYVDHVMGNISDRTSDVGTAPGDFILDMSLTLDK